MTRLSGVIATECERCSLVRSCPASKLETPTNVRRAFDDWLARRCLIFPIGSMNGAKEDIEMPGKTAADHNLSGSDMTVLFRLIIRAETLAKFSMKKLTPVSVERAPELSPVITGRLIGQLFLGEAAT